MSLLKPSTKALNLSSKVSIRMDQRGFISLQYMILTDDSQICFVEFLVCCTLASFSEVFRYSLLKVLVNYAICYHF